MIKQVKVRVALTLASVLKTKKVNLLSLDNSVKMIMM